MKLLEVGDVIYSRHYGKVSNRMKVDRVTPKFAFCGATKFKREVASDGEVRVSHRQKWSTTRHIIETPEIKKEYQVERVINKAKRFDWSVARDWSDEKIMQLHNLMKEDQ